MTLDEMIREWEMNGEVPESRELVRMEKIIRTAIKERASLTAQLAAANTDRERERQRHIKEMNLVLGTVNPLMIALSMDWGTQVAHLCNFAGDPDAIREAWRVASDEAMNRVTNLQNQLAEANKEIARLRKIEEAAKFAREQWGKRDCFLLPLEKQALTQLDEALAGDGGGNVR